MGRRRSPYYAKYVELGAELVDRMGYDAPYRFTTTEAEHMATRTAAGLYDVYHQGMVDIKGKDAEALLQKTCVNDLTRIGDGQVLYSSVCKDDGGMIDDLTIYRVASDHYFLSPTPSRVDAVVAHMTEQARGMNTYVTDRVSGTGFISVQGPNARNIVSQLTDADLSTGHAPVLHLYENDPCGSSGLPGADWLFWRARFRVLLPSRVRDVHVGIGLQRRQRARTGSVRTWRAALDPDGEAISALWARSRRNDQPDRGEPRLDRAVRQGRVQWPGRAASAEGERGVLGTWSLIEFDGLDFLPATGDAVTIDGFQVGNVTSADRGYFVGKSIALAYLQPEVATTGIAVDRHRQDSARRRPGRSISAPRTIRTARRYEA